MKDKLYNILILLPFIWIFSGQLVLRNGDKLMIIAIVISIVATLLKYGTLSIKNNVNDKGLWLVLTIAAYTTFSYYYHGASSREMRALLGLTLLLLTFPRELINRHILQWLLLLGSLFLLCSSYYFSLNHWLINRIPHGTMGATILILALVLFLDSNKDRDKIILGLALFTSFTGLIMNPTRGIWLALIIAVIILLLFHFKAKNLNWRHALISIVILSLGIYVAKPKLEQRIVQVTQVEIKAIQAGNFDTSIGIRLQLWGAAAKNTTANPILGSGDHHQELLNNLFVKGDITGIVTNFNHYHNQFLDRLVKRGIIGLMLLLAVFIYPIASSSGGDKKMAIAVITIYVAAGLTDVPLNHGAPLFMYILLMFTLKKNDEVSG